MGLSRNKVAVSEGAAGSPPFYGDRDRRSARAQRNDRSSKVENKNEKMRKGIHGREVQDGIRCVLVQCTDICYSIVRDQCKTLIWGCSSAGRAPALQAGGQGFDSLHLHHRQAPEACSGKVRSEFETHHAMGNKQKPNQTKQCHKYGVEWDTK